MLSLIGLALALLALPADSAAVVRAELTGDIVSWPNAASAPAIFAAGESDVVTLGGAVASATMGPATVRDSYRALDVSPDATVGRYEAHDLDAQVTAACIRTHADVVVEHRADIDQSATGRRGAIDERTLAALNSFAARTYVPESERSRVRGAGGGRVDDE